MAAPLLPESLRSDTGAEGRGTPWQCSGRLFQRLRGQGNSCLRSSALPSPEWEVSRWGYGRAESGAQSTVRVRCRRGVPPQSRCSPGPDRSRSLGALPAEKAIRAPAATARRCPQLRFAYGRVFNIYCFLPLQSLSSSKLRRRSHSAAHRESPYIPLQPTGVAQRRVGAAGPGSSGEGAEPFEMSGNG